jgi:hypothetical protein
VPTAVDLAGANKPRFRPEAATPPEGSQNVSAAAHTRLYDADSSAEVRPQLLASSSRLLELEQIDPNSDLGRNRVSAILSSCGDFQDLP